MKGAIGWLFGLTIIALSMVTLPSYAAEKLAPLPDPPKVKPAQAKLGMYLFFDPRISGDGAI